MSEYLRIQPFDQLRGNNNQPVMLLSVPALAPTQGTLPAGIPATSTAESSSAGTERNQMSLLTQAYAKTTTRKIRAKKTKPTDGQPPKADGRKLQVPNDNTMVKLKNVLEVNPYNYSGKEQHESWAEVVRMSRPIQTGEDGSVITNQEPVTSTDINSLKALVRRHLDDFSQKHVRRTGTEEEWREWDDIMESIKKYSEGVPLKERNPEKAAREAGLKSRIEATQLGMRSGVTKNSWDEVGEEMEAQDFDMEMGLTDHPDDLGGNLHFPEDEMIDFHADGTATTLAGTRNFRLPGLDLSEKTMDEAPSPSSDTTEIIASDPNKEREKEKTVSGDNNGTTSTSASTSAVTNGASKSARNVFRKRVTEQVRHGRVAAGRNQMMQTFSSMSRTVDRMEDTEQEEKVFERQERAKDREAERTDREKERILKAKLAGQELSAREKDREERIKKDAEDRAERMKKDEEDRKEREQIRAQQFEVQKIDLEMRNKQTEMMLQLMSKFVTGKE